MIAGEFIATGYCSLSASCRNIESIVKSCSSFKNLTLALIISRFGAQSCLCASAGTSHILKFNSIQPQSRAELFPEVTMTDAEHGSGLVILQSIFVFSN